VHREIFSLASTFRRRIAIDPTDFRSLNLLSSNLDIDETTLIEDLTRGHGVEKRKRQRGEGDT